MQISTGKITKAQKVVIYGPEGIGKTCLAASFPNPLFIDVEGSTTQYDVRRAEPAPTSWSMLMSYIDEVKSGGTGICSTLVIDTADWAERLCIEHVLKKHGATGIEDFGWGKGYTYVKEEFARMLDKLSDLINIGVNVVVCAHAQIVKFEQPDELGTYDRWNLKLDKRNAPVLKEWADMLLFCNYKTTIVSPDQKTGGHAKAAGGKRVIFTTHKPAWDAKNRVGLADELPMEFSAIAAFIPQIDTAAVEPPKQAPQTGSEAFFDLVFEEVTEEKEEEVPVVVFPEGAPEHLKPLYDLMAMDGINESDLQTYCAEKGYCTVEAPVNLYPADFTGHLISVWPDIKEEIRTPIK